MRGAFMSDFQKLEFQYEFGLDAKLYFDSWATQRRVQIAPFSAKMSIFFLISFLFTVKILQICLQTSGFSTIHTSTPHSHTLNIPILKTRKIDVGHSKVWALTVSWRLYHSCLYF
jgi:hypothetical protein